MNILVTGSTGLVGARTLPRLIENGYQCRALVRGTKPIPAGADAVEGDVLNPLSLASAVQGVSAIVHLAAVFRTPDADLIWKSNLEGTRNLISAVKAHAPNARFIMASTSNIYDGEAGRPGREDDIATPKQAYPASKLAAEQVLRDSGLTWSVLRFGFVYGDNDGHIESLPKVAAQGQVTFHPAQRMSMIHHRDIAGAIQLALTGAFDGHVMNLTDEAPMSIFELFDLVGEAMEPSSAPLANPWHLLMDGTLSRRLGFRPTVRTAYQAAEANLL